MVLVQTLLVDQNVNVRMVLPCILLGTNVLVSLFDLSILDTVVLEVNPEMLCVGERHGFNFNEKASQFIITGVLSLRERYIRRVRPY